MGRPVAIIGVGQTKHGNRSEITYPDMIREAVLAAYEDAGISPDDIEGVVYGSMPSMMEGVGMNHFYFADALRTVGKDFMRTETCGTTGISLAFTGYYWVASGCADLVLVVGSEKQHEGDSQPTIVTVYDPFYQRPFASGAPGIYSWLCQDWMWRNDLPEDHVRDAAAKLSVDHHRDGILNPYAHIKKEVTADEVKNSPIIVSPIRFLDICPTSDGTCAMILASEEMVKKIGKKPAWVKGVGFRGDEYCFGDCDRVQSESPRQAAGQAYKMAGVTNPIADLDVAELYNPFTFMEMIHYESFGFCEPGQAPEEVLKGKFARGGELPCAPSGGVLCTNPIGACAMLRVAEIALQVTGKAGEHQVEGAKLGFAHGLGGLNQFNGVMILGGDL